MNARALERVVRNIVEPIRRRVMMSIGRAVLRAIDDAGSRQTAQAEVTRGEVRDAIERMQEYGFTSVPHPGADAAIVFVAGNREQGIIIAVEDRRYRLTGLAAGEVALYDDLDQRVHLTRDGIVVDTPLDLSATVGGTATIEAATSIQLTAPTVNVTGNLVVSGDVSDALGSMSEMRTTYNSHTHPGGAGNPPNPQMT